MPNKKTITAKYKTCYASIQALYEGNLNDSFSLATNALEKGANASTVKTFVQEFYTLVQILNETAKIRNESSPDLQAWLSFMETINTSFQKEKLSESAKKEARAFLKSIIEDKTKIKTDAEFVFLDIFLIFQTILFKIDLSTFAEMLGFGWMEIRALKTPCFKNKHDALQKKLASAMFDLASNYLLIDEPDEADTLENAPSEKGPLQAIDNNLANPGATSNAQTSLIAFVTLPSYKQFVETSSIACVAGNILPIPSIDPFSEIAGDIQKKIRQLNRHSYSCGLFKAHPHAEKAKALEALVELVETDALKAWETWDPSSTPRAPKNAWEDFLARHPESHEHITCLAQHRNLFSRLFGWIFLQRTESLKLFQGFLDTALGEAQTSPKLKT